MGAKGSAVSQKELARRQFILHGNPWKVVLVIAAPLLLFTLFNYAYSIIDTIMCSEIGENELNAVGALSQANNLIAALGGGLSAGGSILVAREIGKKNYEKAKSLASALFLYVFAMAILTCALIIPFAAPILRLLNVSETSRKLFVHRNTLVYRLDKIKKLTGLDLREFDHAIIFKIALMVKKYLAANPTKF